MSNTATITPPIPADLEPKFLELVRLWKEQRGVTSFIREMIEKPAYRQIIDLGIAAVPLLLRELEQDPDYWFAALRVLTGENPVPAESRGQLQEMSQAWITWGRQHGYRW